VFPYVLFARPAPRPLLRRTGLLPAGRRHHELGIAWCAPKGDPAAVDLDVDVLTAGGDDRGAIAALADVMAAAWVGASPRPSHSPVTCRHEDASTARL
jgi:hypothetical protein